TAGVAEASVLMTTVESNVAACPGVNVRQTLRLAPGASTPGSPPEMIRKPATRLQSTYVGDVLLEQLMTLMLLMVSGLLPTLVIVRQLGPAVWPRGAEPKLIRLGLMAG